MSLGNRQQGDGIRVASGAFARGANALADGFQIGSQIHIGIVKRKT
jgi:hypothetical protein